MAQAARRAFIRLATPAVIGALTIGLGLPPMAQAGERIQFARGKDSAALRGSVTGSHHRDYVLGARAGQTMSVSLMTEGSAYFNILPPGSQDVGIYNASMDGANARFRLPSNGDYTIRVYLMGDDKDSGRTVHYTLSVIIL
ncbi:MAG: hypothetical protein ACM3ST_11135 [Bdellovibrio bacteriovorus]